MNTALLERWYRAAPADCTLTPETTFRLSEDAYLEPDVVIYKRSDGLKGLDGGTALLVVEIADSSLRYDIGRKAVLYAGFGVRELWVIDAVRLQLRVFRRPSEKSFGEAIDLAAAETAVPAFAAGAFTLRLDDLDIG